MDNRNSEVYEITSRDVIHHVYCLKHITNGLEHLESDVCMHMNFIRLSNCSTGVFGSAACYTAELNQKCMGNALAKWDDKITELTCNHNYKTYHGFNESYNYCTKCDQKKGFDGL